MISIGCDYNGVELKNIIIEYLKENNIEVTDFGTTSDSPYDFPIISKRVTDSILEGSVKEGILICGTGIGMSIATNRVKVYEQLCVQIVLQRK